MMNKVFLLGRMTADVEVRYNEAGTCKGQFTLAVNRTGAKEGTQAVDFFNIVVWNKQAENLEKYMGKGSQLGIEGTLRADSYTDRDGNHRVYNYVLAQSIQYINGFKGEKKEESKELETTSFKSDDLFLEDSDLPF